MKVKAIVNIDDLQDKVFRPVGSEFEVSKERGKFLLNKKVVEIVKEEKEEIKEEKPKTETKKKTSKK